MTFTKITANEVVAFVLYAVLAIIMWNALTGCTMTVSVTPLSDGEEVIQSNTHKVLDNTKAKESRY